MKKIFYLMFILITLLTGLKNANALTSYVNITDSGYYWNRNYNGLYSSHPWNLYEFDGRVAYCIMPNIPEGTIYNLGDYTNSSLSPEIKDRILQIAYYGYEYPGHNTLSYRAAAQELLWETIVPTDVTFSTLRYNEGLPYDVTYEKNEIIKLINNHYAKPSFNGRTYTSSNLKTITLEDANNVLSNYTVVESDTSIATISGNTLIVKPTNVSTSHIKLVKKQYTDKNYIVYYNTDAQTMISSGKLDDIYADVYINFTGGTVEINKLDSDTLTNTPSGQATLQGAIYGIYTEDGTLVSTIVTDINGYAKSDPLPSTGRYYLKEISPSLGYTLDNNKYYFTSSSDNPSIKLEVKEKVIKKKINIVKVFATSKTEVMHGEAGILFAIFDKNGKEVFRGKTNSDGKISTTLVYGDYVLKQLTTSNGYEKIEDFHFEVKDNKELNKVFSNAKIKTKIRVVKKDLESGNVIKKSGFKFKILNLDNNEYVCYTSPNYEKNCEYETNNEGEFITLDYLEAGTYKIIEIKTINGYYLNPDSLTFRIDNNSNINFDAILGNVMNLEFFNKQVRGKFKLYKYGEKPIFTPKGYIYEKFLLDNIQFALYASEDIYSQDGKKIYSKDEEITRFMTKDGTYTLEELYLGKYYLKELTSIKDYQEGNIYYFEITNDNLLEINYYNYLKKGSFELIKEDNSLNPLEGVEISIFEKNTNKLILSKVTLKDGKIFITNLPYGEYYYMETKELFGYFKDPSKYYFTINDENNYIQKKLVNEKIIVKNTKSNKDYSGIFQGLLLIILALLILFKTPKKVLSS